MHDLVSSNINWRDFSLMVMKVKTATYFECFPRTAGEVPRPPIRSEYSKQSDTHTRTHAHRAFAVTGNLCFVNIEPIKSVCCTLHIRTSCWQASKSPSLRREVLWLSNWLDSGMLGWLVGCWLGIGVPDSWLIVLVGWLISWWLSGVFDE